ncbi:lycopene cyclase family protein [Pseudomonadales bacterium]|nr:lycopene cyclase family protein [Pseudomonadales bacterium]
MNSGFADTNCDVLILGGGMSGLALAHYIADYNDHCEKLSKTTWVIEPRQTYTRDKTWCYWQQQTTPFDAAVTHRWYRWQISYNGQTHICECSELPYVRVDSQRYYALAQARLDKSKTVNLLTGTKANKVDVKQTKVSVSCDDLQYEADLVYDTRPKDVAPNTLLQHFVGWEIATDRDAFDPETVTLMDFQSTKNGDIHFFYVLPFDKRRALIETTHFSKTLLPDKVYEEELRTYLTEQLGICEWQIQHEERGIIPMPKNTASQTQRSHQNLIPFGLHGGTAKPSTGYCYPPCPQSSTAACKPAFYGASTNCISGTRATAALARHGIYQLFGTPIRTGSRYISTVVSTRSCASLSTIFKRQRQTNGLYSSHAGHA